MKTRNYITMSIAFAAFMLSAGSCVEKTGTYKTLQAERDSLHMQAQTLEANYNETIGILNEVEAGFKLIRENEGKMMLDLNKVEGEGASKRQKIAAQLDYIKDILSQNKERIEQLQRLAGQKGKENNALTETIKRMETELEEKTAFIVALQSELGKKNIQIDELTTTVGSLNSDVAELSEMSEQQKTTIKNQDTNINTVWYCVANSKQLKDAQIVTNNGLFKAKTVLDQTFDKSLFTQIDLRTISSIPTNSKKVKVLSSHPKDSYNLVANEDKIISIEITDPSKFWSISKYLVVAN